VSRVCERCGKQPVSGRKYARRGLAKYKGGVGRKVTGITKRTFDPNIQVVRVKEPNGTVRRARFCAKCLKTGARNGTITKATRKSRPPKATAQPPAPTAPIEEDTLQDAPVESSAEPVAEAPSEAPQDAPPPEEGQPE
jgi:large subunit ribosomal protein L28